MPRAKKIFPPVILGTRAIGCSPSLNVAAESRVILSVVECKQRLVRTSTTTKIWCEVRGMRWPCDKVASAYLFLWKHPIEEIPSELQYESVDMLCISGMRPH